MRSLKISGLLVLMLASLAACSSSFNAVPTLSSNQPTAAQERLADVNGAARNHGW